MSLVFCWLCNSQDLQVNWSLADTFVTSINFWLFFLFKLIFLVSHYRCIGCLHSTLHSLTFVHWWQNQNCACSIMMILTHISGITCTIKRHSIKWKCLTTLMELVIAHLVNSKLLAYAITGFGFLKNAAKIERNNPCKLLFSQWSINFTLVTIEHNWWCGLPILTIQTVLQSRSPEKHYGKIFFFFFNLGKKQVYR